MADAEVARRLTTIVAGDVAGYSRLVSEDEEGTYAALRAHRRELIDPKIAEHRGRIANTAGDSILIEFPSVIEALRCVLAIQQGMAERNAQVPEERRIRFRVGVNLGDVIEQEDGDLLGDGVNVAARLEGLAEPGGICLSRAARDQVRDRMDVALEDMGEIEVKNIARPVRVFSVLSDAGAATKARRGLRTTGRTKRLAAFAAAALVLFAVAGLAIWLEPWGAEPAGSGSSLSAGTSIAVLPFANLSQNPDQEYFADGITNDLITDLSKFEHLFVIASNSVFTYKGKPVKIQQVGADLGVRYVLEGSVQRLADRVRINAQLIDAANAQHLWAERYDEAVTDLFDLQDRITQQIVRTLAVKLTRLEQERVSAKPTQDMQAYDYVLRGRKLLSASKRADNFEARQLFQRAIERDPGYAWAYAGLGQTYKDAVLYGWTETPQAALEQARDLAQKAVKLDDDSVEGHLLLATVYLIRRQYDLALVETERAIAINPNNAESHASLGGGLVWSGHPEGAIRALETALRFDPLMGVRQLTHLGVAYYLTGRYEDAVKVLERALSLNPDFAYGQTALAATYGQLARKTEAARTAQNVLRLDPFFSTDRFGQLFRKPSDAEALIEGLRKAGLE